MTKVPMGPPPPKNPELLSATLAPNCPPTDNATQQQQLLQQPQEQQHKEQEGNEQQPQKEEDPQPNQNKNDHVNPDPDKTSSDKHHNTNSNSQIPPKSAAAAAVEVPYTIPPWSARSPHAFSLEVLNDGSIIEELDVSGKGAYMFGRVDPCDFLLEDPTISRFHAVLQFNGNGDAFLYDLGSTNGTFINKTQVKKKAYIDLHVGDVIRFGQFSQLYIFQGPSDLMPPESDLTKLRNAKILEEMQDREASLLRARVEGSLADGISWGMADDAIEEASVEDAIEITWQNYQGQLTEKQEKTRAKIIKRAEKISNMKKEIDAIRAKDIAQGGLTQGQQTQIARNEQRISQILEELENLEETLNESIQESIGACARKTVYGKKKGTAEDEDEDEILSDDDEFYDRTKKKKPSIQKAGEKQQIETADSLLDKKEAILKQMKEKSDLLLKEENKTVLDRDGGSEGGDALDAYMTGLSSQLVLDATLQLQKELSALQSELERIQYLLKIADPIGEAARRRDSKAHIPKSKQPDIPASDATKKHSVLQKRSSTSVKPENGPSEKDKTAECLEASKPLENASHGDGGKKPATYTITKPMWLGATTDMDIKENPENEVLLCAHECDDFVDYKDRKKALAAANDATSTVDSMIENAAPGLIIRKRKQMEKPKESDEKVELSTLSSAAAETNVADAVALLLKHQRGYFAAEGDESDGNQQSRGDAQSRKEKVSKRVLGPERPAFLNSSAESETWVPPEGQSGDGRTSLNDRYGY